MLLVMAALPLQAQDDAFCDPYPLVNVNVRSVFEGPYLNTSQNLAAIQAMANTSKDIIPHYDATTLGVTHYEPVIEFSAPMVTRSMPDGTYCSRIEHVDAVLGYRNVIIYMANELTANPCALNHVFEHEQKHVAVNRQLLQEYVPLVRERLMAYFRLYGQFRVPNAQYAESLVREKANGILTDMSTGLLEENRRRQRFIDTPEEYARNNTACGGWINGLMRQFQTVRR